MLSPMKLLKRMILGCQYQISDSRHTNITIGYTMTAASMKSCLLFWKNVRHCGKGKNIKKLDWQMEISPRKYLYIIGCFLQECGRSECEKVHWKISIAYECPFIYRAGWSFTKKKKKQRQTFASTSTITKEKK